jgi:hypothetical protein
LHPGIRTRRKLHNIIDQLDLNCASFLPFEKPLKRTDRFGSTRQNNTHKLEKRYVHHVGRPVVAVSKSCGAGRNPKLSISTLYYHLTYFCIRLRPRPKMSEKKLNRRERLVLSIKARIGQLVYAVQDDDAHLRFEPGCSWWISTLGASAREQYPDGVHFCE